MLKTFIFTIITNKWALSASLCLFLFLMTALLAPYIAPYSFSELQTEYLKAPPFWMEGGHKNFVLGTDDLGRDFLSRLIYGARISLSLALMVVCLSLLTGTTFGLLAGYYGGYWDRITMGIVDIIMSFPGILLAIVIVAVLGPGLLNTVIAVNVVAWPAIIRVVRGETLREKAQDYVQAVQVAGASQRRIMFKHILPNVSAPLLVQAVLGFGESLLNISALGFLGLGARPPLPEWGTMINDGRDLMSGASWLVVFPGLCILLVTLSFNILGGALRDSLDPKKSKFQKKNIAFFKKTRDNIKTRRKYE